jgi:predicted transcriptional regulator
MYNTTLPPSSKTVLEILDLGGAMTHKDLVQKTHLAPRTVRYALKKLKERHLPFRLSTRTGLNKQ